MARIGIGRVYFVAGDLLAVALELEGRVVLVHWHEGVLCIKPLPKKIRAPASTPTFLELLADWGIEAEDLDEFIEREVYSVHVECRQVRGNRRAMGTGLPTIRAGEARGRYLGME